MKTYSSDPGINERLKVIDCPICGCGEFERLWNLGLYSFSNCPKCNLIYQNPQPISEDVEVRYDDQYFNYEINNEESFLNLMLLGLKDIGFVPSKVQDGSKKILDIGCATGLFLSHMKKMGWKTYGIEVCKEACEYGNNVRGVNIFHGILSEASFSKDTFDVIHLSHVIEHINDPKVFLKDVYKMLKPGGFIYCTTPNVDGLQAKWFKGRWRSAIADHLVLFSVKTLNRILKDVGFENLKYRTWGGLCAGSGYPYFVKNILDKLSKPLGFGDVMIFKGVKK